MIVTNGLMGWIAIAFAIPLIMLLAGGVKNALPPGVSKGWAWLTAIFVFLLVADRTGLLESIGFDPRAAMKWLLVCGMGMVLLEERTNRALPWRR
jgi:hypothetical protein